jgi:hypothetical protein
LLLPLVSWFPQGSWPRMPCGVCTIGDLVPAPPATVTTGASQEAEGHPDWEPEWIGGFFTTSAHCSNRECRETAVLLGEMKVDVDVDERGHWHGEYETFLRLRYSEPPLGLMKLPERYPLPVRDAVQAASHVMWSDTSSAANRLRVAVTELLTAMNVRKMTPGRKRMTTHGRIEALRDTKPEIASILEAVKWIGNARHPLADAVHAGGARRRSSPGARPEVGLRHVRQRARSAREADQQAPRPLVQPVDHSAGVGWASPPRKVPLKCGPVVRSKASITIGGTALVRRTDDRPGTALPRRTAGSVSGRATVGPA